MESVFEDDRIDDWISGDEEGSTARTGLISLVDAESNWEWATGPCEVGLIFRYPTFESCNASRSEYQDDHVVDENARASERHEGS